MKRNIRNPHRALAAHPQLALAVLPASAIDADALDHRPQPRLASCGEGKKGGFFSRLWRGIKNVLGRIGKWIRNHCVFGNDGGECTVTF